MLQMPALLLPALLCHRDIISGGLAARLGIVQRIGLQFRYHAFSCAFLSQQLRVPRIMSLGRQAGQTVSIEGSSGDAEACSSRTSSRGFKGQLGSPLKSKLHSTGTSFSLPPTIA